MSKRLAERPAIVKSICYECDREYEYPSRKIPTPQPPVLYDLTRLKQVVLQGPRWWVTLYDDKLGRVYAETSKSILSGGVNYCGCKPRSESSSGMYSYINIPPVEQTLLSFSAGNARNAFYTRIAVDTPVQDGELWFDLWPTLMSTINNIGRDQNGEGESLRFIEPNFQNWRNSFPLAMKKKIMSTIDDYVVTWRSYAATGFSKYEPNAREEDNYPKARFISNVCAQHFMISGAYMNLLSKIIRSHYDGHNGIVYANGYNAQSLGHKLYELGWCNYSMWFEFDLQRCDTTIRAMWVTLEYYILKGLGFPEWISRFMTEQPDIHGKILSKLGVPTRYVSAKQRESGSSHTSAMNSAIVAIVWESLLHWLYPNRNFLIVLGGDDSAGATDATEEEVKVIAKYMNMLGVMPEMACHKDPYSPKFFSGYFLPAIVDGHESLIHTTAPARFLAKSVVVKELTKDPKSMMKEITKMRIIETQHCPLLNRFHLAMWERVKNFPDMSERRKRIVHREHYMRFSKIDDRVKIQVHPDINIALSIIYNISPADVYELTCSLVDAVNSIDIANNIGIELTMPLLSSMAAHDIEGNEAVLIDRQHRIKEPNDGLRLISTEFDYQRAYDFLFDIDLDSDQYQL